MSCNIYWVSHMVINISSRHDLILKLSFWQEDSLLNVKQTEAEVEAEMLTSCSPSCHACQGVN